MPCDKEVKEEHLTTPKHEKKITYASIPQAFADMQKKYDGEFLGYISRGGEHYE
jgi:hypothetical protein